jgi:hypothetical protein
MAGERWNESEFVAISNAVLDAVVAPAAEAMAERARSIADTFAQSGTYRDSIEVVVDRRPGVDGWGRAIVTTRVGYGMQVEARHGVLAKAAGQ